MGLASPHTEEVVKYVDKVGGFEWLIDKNEIDGASALKLDLSLDAPIIIVPKNSMSKELVSSMTALQFHLTSLFVKFYDSSLIAIICINILLMNTVTS